MTLIKKLNVHDYEFFILQITYLLTYLPTWVMGP